MKRRRPRKSITEEQQVILAVLAIVLLAISMLYCLGFATIIVRQIWEGGPLPRENIDLPQESLDATPTLPTVQPTLPATALP
jgi:hypothetical protein